MSAPPNQGLVKQFVMAVFTYKAVSGDASAVSGLIVAETPREARDSLRARGLTVEEGAPRESGATGSLGVRGLFRRRGGRGDAARVNGFIRELSTLLGGGRPLAWPTGVVKDASDFLVHQWWVLLLVLAGIVIGVRLVLRTPRGRWHWHRAQLRIPIMGELIRKQAVVRLCVVLSTLLRSGLVFVHSLQIARRTTSNLILADALERCEAAVQNGRDIGE